MKVVILAGGLGTRISEETQNKPKPMVNIGDKPILWHIMNIYSRQGYKDFIICGGYKLNVIKNFFQQFDGNKIIFNYNGKKLSKKNSYKKSRNTWNVNLIDTGLQTYTGGRLKRLEKILKNEQNFFFTYGDGLSNLNIKKLLKLHLKQKTIATLTAVTPPSRFGVLKVKNNKVKKFLEKKDFEKDFLVNGGFFVFNQKIFNFLKNDNTILEQQPLEKLARINQLSSYLHLGSWFSMDTQRDQVYLDKLYKDKKHFW
tara:strand:- start:48 stop:815 length:768 start_codon:yes stop_codon:yes gene_type:complete